ncbi:MAG TPA: hypothetical protein DCZ55_34550, partial [Cyanobacteria bacterium UBA11371]|nr:hypothetical protein [Cyanobacteria bacterium UBA11371]
IAATNNGLNGLEVKDVAEGNKLTISDSSFTGNTDDGIDINGSNNKLNVSDVQLSNNKDDGFDIGGNAN